jgi:hypothetical protein
VFTPASLQPNLPGDLASAFVSTKPAIPRQFKFFWKGLQLPEATRRRR